MKSKKISEKILRSIKFRGFNNITLDPVLETKYILQRSGENFKKYLFSKGKRVSILSKTSENFLDLYFLQAHTVGATI